MMKLKDLNQIDSLVNCTEDIYEEIVGFIYLILIPNSKPNLVQT